MKSKIKSIFEITSSFLTPELINSILLPEDLLDPRTEEEIKERYFFMHHSILMPMGAEVAKILGCENLDGNELSIVSERIEAYLKQQGF
jgi:hypothetical protein